MNKVVIIILLVICCLIGFYVYNQLGKQGGSTPQQQVRSSSPHLSPQEFHKELSSGKYQLIDIRTYEEYIDGHIKGAVQQDYYQTEEFRKYLESLDKNKSYLIYCRSAKRSGAALDIMKEMGFTDVKDLEGGYNAWISQDLPTEK